MHAIRTLVASLCIFALTGCEAVQVVTFQGHPESGYGKSKLTVELIGEIAGPSADQTARRDFDSFCQTSGQAHFAAVLAPVVVAAATFIVDKSSQALQDWITKKQKQFQTSDSVTSNSDAFLTLDAKSGQFVPSVKCIVIKQYVAAKTDLSSAEPDQEAFVFAGVLATTADFTAFKIYPTYYKLSRATALTDSGSGKVDVDIKLIFNVVGAGDSASQKASGLGTAEISLKTLALPSSATSAVFHSLQDANPDSRLGSTGESILLPVVASDAALKNCKADAKCKAFEPVSITMTFAETGTGSDAFGQLAKDISDNTKTIETAVTSAVQSATGSSSSSSSKGGGK